MVLFEQILLSYLVFGGGFEEFVAAIGGEGAHACSGGLHRLCVGRYFVKKDLRG
jgi:hypothetical protein